MNVGNDFVKMDFFTDKPIDFNSNVEISVIWVEVDGDILFVQKSTTSKDHPGLWAPPGGKIDLNEDPIQAAKRELEEEVGVIVEDNNISPLIKLYVKAPTLDFIYHMYALNCPLKPNIYLSKEHQDYCWVTLDEAINLDLMIGVKETIKIYCSKMRIN
jgi:8-oxo-dGTP diphosphatase